VRALRTPTAGPPRWACRAAARARDRDARRRCPGDRLHRRTGSPLRPDGHVPKPRQLGSPSETNQRPPAVASARLDLRADRRAARARREPPSTDDDTVDADSPW